MQQDIADESNILKTASLQVQMPSQKKEKVNNKLFENKLPNKKAQLRPIITISKYQSKAALNSWNDLDNTNQLN